MAHGGGVLLTFRGLPPDATEADLREVVNAPVHSAHIQKAGGRVLYGECHVKNITEALNILRTCNFTMVRRCAVKIQLGTGKQPLSHNQRIEIPQLLPGVGEPEVFGYFKQFGTIIRIEVDQQKAFVWYANGPEALRAGCSVSSSGLVGTVPVYEIMDSGSDEEGMITDDDVRLDIIEERGCVGPYTTTSKPPAAPTALAHEPSVRRTERHAPVAADPAGSSQSSTPRPQPLPAKSSSQAQIMAKGAVPVRPAHRPNSATMPAGGGTPIQLPRPTVPLSQRPRAQAAAVKSLAPARSTRPPGAPAQTARPAQMHVKPQLTTRSHRQHARPSTLAQLQSWAVNDANLPAPSLPKRPLALAPSQTQAQAQVLAQAQEQVLAQPLRLIDTKVCGSAPAHSTQPSNALASPVGTPQTAPCGVRSQAPIRSPRPPAPLAPTMQSPHLLLDGSKRSLPTPPSHPLSPASIPLSAPAQSHRQVLRPPSVAQASQGNLKTPVPHIQVAASLPRPPAVIHTKPRSPAPRQPSQPSLIHQKAVSRSATPASAMPLPGTLKATTPQPTTTRDPAPAPAPTEPSELPAKRARVSGPDPPVSQLSSLPNSPSKPHSLEVSNPQPADLAPPNATVHAALLPEQNQQPIAPVIPGLSLVSTQHPGNKKSLAMHTPPHTPFSSVQDGSPKQSTDPLPPPAQAHSDACTISSIVSSPATSTATLAAVASERREGFARKSTRTRGRTLTTQAIQQYHARIAAMKTAHPVVPRKNVLGNALKRKLPEVEHPPQPRSQSHQQPISSAQVRDFMTMDKWRASIPLTYDMYYRHVPFDKAERLATPLSIAWRPLADRSGAISAYLSIGNLQARDNAISADSADAKSVVALTNMHLAPLGSSESIETVLDQFRRNHVTILNAGKVKDKNETAIRSLRMHGGGNLMLGCTGRTIIMWDTENFVQKGTLRLMGDINDVYDVGGDYLVANSTQSKVGVWKRDSSNFMWCFNGARQFSKKSDGCRIATAIKVNASGQTAYVGDVMGSLSLCDFRDRYMTGLSTTFKGAVKGVETVRDWGVAVGTDAGELSLVDVRFIKDSSMKKEVHQLKLPADVKSIGAIRICPHNPDMFACTADNYVCIYDVAEKTGGSRIFAHEAHQSPVVDFDWNPCDKYQYTIGSLEAGIESGQGELHVWRPSTMALFGV